MAIQVLPGGITTGVRRIKKADYPLQVNFDLNNNSKARLTVVENGDVSSVPISKKVAEILVANDISWGD